VLREKMERLGVPQYWQKDVWNGVSFEVGINQQSVSYQRGEKAYDQSQAADEAYNWYYNEIMSGRTVTKSDFARQDFAGRLSGSNKVTFANIISNAEKGGGHNWATGGNLKTFDWMAEKYKLSADEKVYVWQKINNANEQSIADTGAPLDEGQIKSIVDHEASSIKVNPSGVFDRAKAWWNGESKIDSGHRFAEAPLGFEPIDTKPGWFRTPDNDEVHWVEGKGWTNVK